MITYKTYQEAKIAHPESEIYVSMSGDFADENYVSYVSMCGTGDGWNKCNPSDYCISIAEFKERGLELANGDIYELEDAGVFQVGFGGGISVDYSSQVNGLRYILRAKALEKPKPTRTKVSYEKVTDSIFDLKDEFERGELYQLVSKSEYRMIKNTECLAACLKYGNAHRKVETPIRWQEEVDNHFLKTKLLGIDCTIEEAITRSDYCEEFLEVCRVALRANGELTDKA